MAISDPEEFLEGERHADHERARLRGQRISDLADAVLRRLQAEGILNGHRLEEVRPILWSLLADDIYGSTTAIDIPPLRNRRH